MKGVVSYIVEINQPYRRYGFQTIIKTSTEVIIIQFLTNIFQNLKILPLKLRILSFKLLLKNWQQNICVTVIDCAILIFAQLTILFE